MKKQINFSDEPQAYRFALEGNDVYFEIKKDSLAFSSNDFYELFFKGMDEKPEYELVKPDGELKGQAKHVYDTVAAILKKTCDSIDADWFKVPDEQADDNSDDASVVSS